MKSKLVTLRETKQENCKRNVALIFVHAGLRYKSLNDPDFKRDILFFAHKLNKGRIDKLYVIGTGFFSKEAARLAEQMLVNEGKACAEKVVIRSNLRKLIYEWALEKEGGKHFKETLVVYYTDRSAQERVFVEAVENYEKVCSFSQEEVGEKEDKVLAHRIFYAPLESSFLRDKRETFVTSS